VFEDSYAVNKGLVGSIESLMANKQAKFNEEQEGLEQLEVQLYEQTVKSHMYHEEMDSLLVLMEEFIKRVREEG